MDSEATKGFGLALGAGLVLAEIISAQVLLSQMGNVLILVSAIAFAKLLLRGSAPKEAA